MRGWADHLSKSIGRDTVDITLVSFPPFFFFFFLFDYNCPTMLYEFLLCSILDQPSNISPTSFFFSTDLEADFIIDSFVKFTRSFFWVFHLLPLIYSYIYAILFLIYLFIWLCWVSVAASGIFSCGLWDLVPWPGIKFRLLALGSWSLSHWTTREVPGNSKYTV